MYVTGPGNGGPSGGLAVRRSLQTHPLPRPGAVPRTETRTYLADMFGMYQMPYDDARFASGSHVSYADLTSQLLEPLAPEALDIVVVAHSTIDCDIRRAIGAAVGQAGHDALCFAVTDQGPLAAFTALRLVHGYARQGGCGRAAVLVLRQATVPHGDAGDADVGVALLLDRVDGPGTVHLVTRSVRPGDVAAQARDVLHSLGGADPDAVLLLGAGAAEAAPHLADGRSPEHVVACPPSPGHMALWTAAAEHLSEARARRVVLLEYDPHREQLAAAALAEQVPDG
jgi:hypothetical protein